MIFVYKIYNEEVSFSFEPRSISFRKTYFEIDQALGTCIEKMPIKNKLVTSKLVPWKESILLFFCF